ncbi:hypothetical protein, partial [Nitrobacter sp.]|uniref:hypothetical protein n=1 Tax=Nitrobacter sp. TaxID=29420 RepID=UPI003F6541DE
ARRAGSALAAWGTITPATCIVFIGIAGHECSRKSNRPAATPTPRMSITVSRAAKHRLAKNLFEF